MTLQEKIKRVHILAKDYDVFLDALVKNENLLVSLKAMDPSLPVRQDMKQGPFGPEQKITLAGERAKEVEQDVIGLRARVHYIEKDLEALFV